MDNLAVLPPWGWETLQDRARARVATLTKHTPESIAKICKNKKAKKGGPDGWEFCDLYDLSAEAYAGLADIFNDLEAELSLPLQMSCVQVVMLAKTVVKERPIGLTSVLWRFSCKTRRHLVSQWLDEYSPAHPWDAAVLGRTSVDMALARLMSKEHARVQGVHAITLFVAIARFYESVSWQRLITQGLKMDFPAVILDLAIELYKGPRILMGEGLPSPSIFPGRGMIQGCPFAPTLAQLTLAVPLQNLVRVKGLEHCDVWLDDISADFLHTSAKIAVGAALEGFQVLKQSLSQEGLVISQEKTILLQVQNNQLRSGNS